VQCVVHNATHAHFPFRIWQTTCVAYPYWLCVLGTNRNSTGTLQYPRAIIYVALLRLSAVVRSNDAASAFCSTGGNCSGSSSRRNGHCKMQRPFGLAHSWGAGGLPQLNCLWAPPASPFPCRAPAGHLHHRPRPSTPPEQNRVGGGRIGADSA
jgi:hypothetical protein